MDQASGSPAESRERAVSAEPSSTRPKPFDDNKIAARKRQRTSLSGASRSRSVDSMESSPDQDQPSNNSHREADDESVMRIDSEPSAPQTPERQRGQSEPTTEPKSSQVTINLRNAQHPLETIPSSPLTPGSGLPDSQPAAGEDIKVSVEESEMETSSEQVAAEATPAVATPDTGSPPIELVTGPADDEVDFVTSESHVTLLEGIQDSLLVDPSPEFPYHGHGEIYADTMAKLAQFVTTHEEVAPTIRDWIENYLAWVRSAESYTMLSSYQHHRHLWSALPDLIFQSYGRKLSSGRFPQIPQYIAELYSSFARLTEFFMELDFKTLRHLSSLEDTHYPELASPTYVYALSFVTRRDESQTQNGYVQDADGSWDDPAVTLEGFLTAKNGANASFALLLRIIETYADLIPRFPKLIEQFGHLSQLVLNILRESHRKLQMSTADPSTVELAKTRLASAYQFYQIMSTSLSTCMEKYVNHLNHEAASTMINCLTDIFRLSLQMDHLCGTSELAKEHRQTHHAIAAQDSPEVIASDWKFTIFSKMIMSSQMQLRVMAVTQMCQDLVGVWKRQSETAEDTRSAAILQYFADFLLRTGLVAYILGSKCHPEITIESGNVIGFLLVTQTYKDEHTDAMWQTVTSTQDPRVSDALLRMTARIANLYSYEGLLYICHKLQTLPIEMFNPTVRELCDCVFKALPQKGFDRTVLDNPPFVLCLRLLRESSVFGQHSPIAYPEIQSFATQKFQDLQRIGPSPEGRNELYQVCLADLSEKNEHTLGSLWALSMLSRSFLARDLGVLTGEHDLTRLLVDELEDAISSGREAGYPSVIAGPVNTPRRELILSVMLQQPATISTDLGLRLWDMLVGSQAACPEDRDSAWQVLNHVLRRSRTNEFIQTCLSKYLPTLSPDCFCAGALEFVLEGVRPFVDDAASIMLDDDDDQSTERASVEQLWRMILSAPHNTIESRAIEALVSKIYVDSKSILTFSHHRARKVHLALVSRCLGQLSAAAQKLKAFSSGATSGDDDSMVITAPESQTYEQELLFVRSLAVLREFLKLHQAKAQFAAPDLRSLSLPSPNAMEGESAELKYQSFDGENQTEVKPLNIGRLNTAGALLASLRDATGFDNYRIYYKGQAFVPQERDICKSLEDLQIQNGLILVKRESDAIPSPVKIRPGSSPVEIEILAHFGEMWEYLSMEEKLANEIYSFLVKLPADEGILQSFLSSTTSYKDVFPVGEPFKSLYAVHALQDFVAEQRRLSASGRDLEVDGDDHEAKSVFPDVLRNAAVMLVSAVSDPEVADQSPSEELRIFLDLKLVETLLVILKDALCPDPVFRCLDERLLNHLTSNLTFALKAQPTENIQKLITIDFHTIMVCCSASKKFWNLFRKHGLAKQLIELLLLKDSRPFVRQQSSKLILDKVATVQSPSAVLPADFRAFFWPVIFDLMQPALKQRTPCEELFSLVLAVFKILRETDSSVLDLEQVINDCSKWLLDYTTNEDVTQPEMVDMGAYGFIRFFHSVWCTEEFPVPEDLFPESVFARRLFWRHLFPRSRTTQDWANGGTILYNATRGMLIEIIFVLVEQDERALTSLLEDLNKLVPFGGADEEDDPYLYELPQQFERLKAIRSSCGYVGMRNLSNTCYLNSLFTQLFMNTSFRRFILNSDIQDPNYSQNLMVQTRNLFGYLQESIRRFVDPTGVVCSVKTYDDTPIDIHNQMDVDEFYNLLFDRWEGQLLSASAKREFRSYYGGQLVQQVKSKECDHISERLEPFSAIQCDIKGKNTLQESLQAYVDGEIMEGDNKYKCSTCDRHVDAVKRASLKDIPDNLIFHLKRFDFNLKTLQRAKINEYFAFPSRIDMRPYTTEHLMNPSEVLPEDVFELVGVLVHSGTAESGHYYSYIRERPTTKPNETWIEFNDDNVTSWDPAQMENSCFGGPDYRPPFDANGIVYDKTYSAYMLFYQRSSALQREQEALQVSGRSSPVKVRMPEALADNIRSENTSLLRRHCLYDPAHIRFVGLAIDRVKNLFMNIESESGCTPDHRIENLTIEMAISHLDQVASRAKDVPDFRNLYSRVQDMCEGCTNCCLTVYEYFKERPEVLRVLVQRNPESFVRHESCLLLIKALQHIKRDCPNLYTSSGKDDDDDASVSDIDEGSDVAHGAAIIFRPLWDNFHTNIRSWPEVFGLMGAFVRLGHSEMAAFLDYDYFKRLLWIIIADANLESTPPQYNRMLNTVTRRMPNRPPSYESIIGLLGTLMTSMSIPEDAIGGVHLAEDGEPRLDTVTDDAKSPFTFTKPECQLIFRDWGHNQANIFLDKLIGLNQNHESTDSIVAHLMKLSLRIENKVYWTLRHGISGQITPQLSSPYLRVATLFCRLAHNADLIRALVTHVATQCKSLQNGEGRTFFEFFRDVFEIPRENSGDPPEAVHLHNLQILPIWAPGLLGFYDPSVTSEVENLLHEKLFKYGPSPGFDTDNGGAQRSDAVNNCARQLGMDCLLHVRDNYIRRNVSVSNNIVSALQRVVMQCHKYFTVEDGSTEELNENYAKLSQAVLESLHRLSVEELEEDASGMLYSDSSSVTSSITAC